MEISFDFITFIHLAAVVVGLVSSAVILYFGIRTSPANQPLGIGQLSISLAIFVSFSIVSQLLVHWPFMYRLGNVFVLIFIPMPYLYTVFYTRRRSWKWYDVLHVIPLLIYLIDYWQVLTLSSAQKAELLLQEINHLDTLGEFRQGTFIGPGFHQEFRTVLFSAYWVAQLIILIKWIKNQKALSRMDKVWKNWMVLFLGCQFFLWFPFYLTIFWLDKLTTYHIVNSFSVGWIVVSSFSLFFFPSLLYGTSFDGYGGTSGAKKATKKSALTADEEEKLDEVMRQIESQLDKSQLFLNQGYSINDFSNDMDLPVYQISKSISHTQGMGFVDYINQKRILYCAERFRAGEWLNYTVEAVANECGFNNRNSFTNAFKKFLGTSPSEYRGQFKD